MTKDRFLSIESYMEKHGILWRVMYFVAKCITIFTFACYPVLLLILFVGLLLTGGYRELFLCILVPGISFVGLSIFRKAINCKRPYEIWDTTPLINKKTKGNSFPSRHVFSIFMIGMTFVSLNLWIGYLILAFGIYLAVFRVVAGVHFIKDVLAGAAVGFFCGIILYLLLNF